MTKASIELQDLRRRIYVKAKAEPSWRFWGLYVHVCKTETLRAAYEMAKTERWSSRRRRGHLRGHRGTRRGGSARAAARRTDRAHLQTTTCSEARDTEGRGQSPRPGNPGDPGQGGARGAQAGSRGYCPPEDARPRL